VKSKNLKMKKIIILFALHIGLSLMANAQFIESGEIEFEVKTNIKKTMGNTPWGEMMKDKLPNFKTAYYKFSFNQNKSNYQFDHWENKDLIPDMFRKSDEQSIWYSDFDNNKFVMQKDVFGTAFNIKDSAVKIEWKLSNENRIISGYNCRKAVGKIMDSVYVFAFYTEEITIPGGPCTIHGLPGMILGMTIPRLYTSWIATKIIDKSKAPVVAEPTTSKNVFTLNAIQKTIIEKTKEWGGDDDDPESRKWIEQLIWNVLL
jgi:hypothetical protein